MRRVAGRQAVWWAGGAPHVGVVAAADELAADEDPGHRAAAGQLQQRVLDGVAVATLIELYHGVLRLGEEALQGLLGFCAEWAVRFGPHDDLPRKMQWEIAAVAVGGGGSRGQRRQQQHGATASH